jgi:hypothetical protein
MSMQRTFENGNEAEGEWEIVLKPRGIHQAIFGSEAVEQGEPNGKNHEE